MRVSEDIVPIAEFKAHLSEVVRDLRAHARPVVVTQNGKPAAVVMSPEEFDRLSARAHVLGAISEGLEDEAAGRTVSDDELGLRLDERYGRLPRSRRR